MPNESNQRDYKSHIKNVILGIVIGGGMGAGMSYVAARGQEIPKTIQQYAMGHAITGLIAGAMGGALSVLVPYVIIPRLHDLRERYRSRSSKK